MGWLCRVMRDADSYLLCLLLQLCRLPSASGIDIASIAIHELMSMLVCVSTSFAIEIFYSLPYFQQRGDPRAHIETPLPTNIMAANGDRNLLRPDPRVQTSCIPSATLDNLVLPSNQWHAARR
jgi:hypothetical protein